MSTGTISVESYAVRGAKPEELIPTVQVSLSAEAITVGELIRRTLIEQISALTVSKLLDSVMAREQIARLYLTTAEIAEQAQSGSVRAPTDQKAVPDVPKFDVEHEVRKAWRGFERRAFRVVVDGQMPNELGHELLLREDSKIAFMRLTPLIGG